MWRLQAATLWWEITSVPLTDGVAVVTPQPEDRIQFQPGDVLGFMLENTDGTEGGVVLLRDSSERDDSGYETEEVWHADVSNAVIRNGQCLFPVGTGPGRILNISTNAAPVISVSYSKLIHYAIAMSISLLLYLTTVLYVNSCCR